MLASLALLAAALAGGDTTVTVTRGQRLDVNIFAGSVTVRSWNRDQVRIEGDGEGSRARLEVDAAGSRVQVRTSARYGPAGSMDVTVTIPAWMATAIEGVYTDVTVQGCRCAVTVETVKGDVRIEGGEGNVSAQSVEGAIEVQGVNGRVEAHTVNEDVRISDVTGDVAAETVNGDVTLRGVRGASVEASTVNGDVSLDGEFRRGGRYALSSHEGDLTVTVPSNPDLDVSVNTFNGEFESDIPVTLQKRAGRRFSFTLGSGGARLELESFSGDIRLVKAGGAAPRRGAGKPKADDRTDDDN